MLKSLRTLLQFLAIVIVALSATVARAQVSPEDSRDIEEHIRDMRMREKIDKANKKKSGTKVNAAQLQEDFTRIQVIDNDLVELSTKATLDLTFIGDSAADIEKRATRLLENLELPPPAKDEKPVMWDAVDSSDNLRKSLAR